MEGGWIPPCICVMPGGCDLCCSPSVTTILCVFSVGCIHLKNCVCVCVFVCGGDGTSPASLPPTPLENI